MWRERERMIQDATAELQRRLDEAREALGRGKLDQAREGADQVLKGIRWIPYEIDPGGRLVKGARQVLLDVGRELKPELMELAPLPD